MNQQQDDHPIILDILNHIFYFLFMVSLYVITKPLAYMVDVTGRDEDIKFLDEES
jgi:hypothetical protein